MLGHSPLGDQPVSSVPTPLVTGAAPKINPFAGLIIFAQAAVMPVRAMIVAR